MPKYTLKQKIKALDAIQQGKDYIDIIKEYDVSLHTLKKWQTKEATLRREYRHKLQADAANMMAQVQYDMADKSLALIGAIDVERITKAPLNQVASTLGVLIDRFLKLHETDLEIETEENTAEQVIRIEYYDATTGKVSQTPFWAEENPESSGTVQGGSVRQTLRQDADGASYRNGKSMDWDADMVARTDVSNGESGLARFEDSDDERNWYHD